MEDFSIANEYKGRKVLLNMVNALKEIAWYNNCFEIVLECMEHN